MTTAEPTQVNEKRTSGNKKPVLASTITTVTSRSKPESNGRENGTLHKDRNVDKSKKDHHHVNRSNPTSKETPRHSRPEVVDPKSEVKKPKRNGSSGDHHQRHHHHHQQQHVDRRSSKPVVRPVRADSYSPSPVRTIKKKGIKRKRSLSASSGHSSSASNHNSHSDEDGSCSCDDHSSIQSDSESDAQSYSLHSNSPTPMDDTVSKKHKKDSKTLKDKRHRRGVSPCRSSPSNGTTPAGTKLSTSTIRSDDKSKRARRQKEGDEKEEEKEEAKDNHRQEHDNNNTRTTTVSASRSKSERNRDYPSLVKYFFKDSIFFVIKSNNFENVHIAKQLGVWSTPAANEQKLNRAFQEFRNVLLIFSVKESGKFQGFARLASESDVDHPPVPWILPPGLNVKALGGVFSLDWINTNELLFTKTLHLFNPLNEGKPVKIARDGQEIEPRVGEELCRLFAADETTDLIPKLKRMKKQTSNRPKKMADHHHHHSTRSSMEYWGVIGADQHRSQPSRHHLSSSHMQSPVGPFSSSSSMNNSRSRMMNRQYSSSAIMRPSMREDYSRLDLRQMDSSRMPMGGLAEFRRAFSNFAPFPMSNPPFSSDQAHHHHHHHHHQPNNYNNSRMDFKRSSIIDNRSGHVFDRVSQDPMRRQSNGGGVGGRPPPPIRHDIRRNYRQHDVRRF